MKCALLSVLILPVCILGFTAVAAVLLSAQILSIDPLG